MMQECALIQFLLWPVVKGYFVREPGERGAGGVAFDGRLSLGTPARVFTGLSRADRFESIQPVGGLNLPVVSH